MHSKLLVGCITGIDRMKIIKQTCNFSTFQTYTTQIEGCYSLRILYTKSNNNMIDVEKVLEIESINFCTNASHSHIQMIMYENTN